MRGRRRGCGDGGRGIGDKKGRRVTDGIRTSGNVPLEKTLSVKVVSKEEVVRLAAVSSPWQDGRDRDRNRNRNRNRGRQGQALGSLDSHKKTGLSTSTVTDNDQLATDFRHSDRVSIKGKKDG